MGITKQLTKHGNSFALIIDKPVLELIGIDTDALIEITSPDGHSLVLTPIENHDHKKKFNQSLNKINKKYKKTLKKLA